jgi:hypothetical protein
MKLVFNWLTKQKALGADWCDSLWASLIGGGSLAMLFGLTELLLGHLSTGGYLLAGGAVAVILNIPAGFLAEMVAKAAKEREERYIAPCPTQLDNTFP